MKPTPSSNRPPAAPEIVIGLRASTRTSGGGVVFLRELAAALAEHPGARVVVFAVGAPSGFVWPAGIEVVPVKTPRSRYLARATATNDLQRAIDDHPVDVLICPGTEVTLVDGPLIAIWPLTVAPFEREALAHLGATWRQRLRWRLLRQFVTRACSKAHIAFFSSAYARDLHQEAVPQLRDIQTIVAHPATSLHRKVDSPMTGDKGLHLLYVSHLYPYKMVVEMIEAYGQALQGNPLLPPLVIAGGSRDTAYAAKIERARQATGNADKVFLLGEVNQDRLDALYKSATAFIFPSISENAGSYALIDAFKYGLPVICSSTSSMPEICGDAALLVDPNDVQAMAIAIARVCSDPTFAEDLATRSAGRFLWLPTWAEIADTVVAGCALALRFPPDRRD